MNKWIIKTDSGRYINGSTDFYISINTINLMVFANAATAQVVLNSLVKRGIISGGKVVILDIDTEL